MHSNNHSLFALTIKVVAKKALACINVLTMEMCNLKAEVATDIDRSV